MKGGIKHMSFNILPSSQELQSIQRRFPQGTQIKLLQMTGEPQMKPGTLGTVKFVDGIGQVHVTWQNGSSLALDVNMDKFEIL